MTTMRPLLKSLDHLIGGLYNNIYDLVGNVGEYTREICKEEYNVYRGGTWDDTQACLGSSSDRKPNYQYKINDVGYRPILCIK